MRSWLAPYAAAALVVMHLAGCALIGYDALPPLDDKGDALAGWSASQSGGTTAWGGGAIQTGATQSTGGDPPPISGAMGAGGGDLATGGDPVAGSDVATGSVITAGGDTTTGVLAITGGALTGGADQTGGMPGTGGSSSTGGFANTGGMTGGTQTTGGIADTGGTTTGGMQTTGGIADTGGMTTGGMQTTGGIADTGGIASTGGSPSTGGFADTGGITFTGGVTVTGGISVTGGINATGGSMDAGVPNTCLAHRYSFSGTGTSVVDSVNAANGLFLGGSTLNGAGQAPLDGVDDYIQLPGGIISSLTSATFVAWIDFQGSTCGQRVFTLGSGGLTGTWISLDMRRCNAIVPAPVLWFQDGAVLDSFDGSATLTKGAHMFAVVIDEGSNSVSWYLDGTLIQSGALPYSLSILPDTDNVLGKPPTLIDPYFQGSFDELRIYCEALNQDDVNALMDAGPDVLP